MTKRIRKPKCSCGLTLVEGVCPEGCGNFKKPAEAIRLSERGAKPESTYGYLTVEQVNRGMLRCKRPIAI